MHPKILKAYENNPIVYNAINHHLRNNVPYAEALELGIIALVENNDNLHQQLIDCYNLSVRPLTYPLQAMPNLGFWQRLKAAWRILLLKLPE